MVWHKARQQYSQARSSAPVHWLSIPGPNSLLSLLTIEQERFWVQPETRTARQILVVEILSHNAKHQFFTHHELHEAIIFGWNSELQVVGNRGVFNAGGQIIETDRQTDITVNNPNYSEAQKPLLALTLLSLHIFL